MNGFFIGCNCVGFRLLVLYKKSVGLLYCYIHALHVVIRLFANVIFFCTRIVLSIISWMVRVALQFQGFMRWILSVSRLYLLMIQRIIKFVIKSYKKLYTCMGLFPRKGDLTHDFSRFQIFYILEVRNVLCTLLLTR